MATRRLGIVKVNTYIYVNPFVTLITGALFLHEPITLMSVIGALLIICAISLRFYPLAGKKWDETKKALEEKHRG